MGKIEDMVRLSEKHRANRLSGKDWLRHSISIWDISKGKEDRVEHPAVFPVELVERILLCYTSEPVLVLDPFMGSGTTLLACQKLGYPGIGFEVYEEYVLLAKERLGMYTKDIRIIHDTVENADSYLEKDSIGLVITSPPYWNVLRRKRSADRKKSRFYGHSLLDFGNIENYEDYLKALVKVFAGLKPYLKEEAMLFVNVMDLRVGSNFYTLHADLICLFRDYYKIEDIIIWDRRKDYNNLKPLGYPYKFVLNRVHEYILVLANV